MKTIRIIVNWMVAPVILPPVLIFCCIKGYEFECVWLAVGQYLRGEC